MFVDSSKYLLYLIYYSKYTNSSVHLFMPFIDTHYIHIVQLQDFASDQTCCLNQYVSSSRYNRDTIQILCQHIMYVISLSNI